MKWGYYTPILRVTTNAYKRQQTLELQTYCKRQQTRLLQTYYSPILRGTTNGDKRKTILHQQSNYKRQQMPTNWPTTHYYKRSLQTPTNANKQIVNFFIF